MKHFPLTIIVAVLLVGCGKAQHSTGDKPAERVAEVTQPAASSKPLSEADSALMDAANKGNIDAVKQHLTGGADVNAKDKRGRTPLHRAAREGHKEDAELLLAKDADVNAKSESGLLKGETPLDEAIKRKRTEVADLLRKHGGKYGSITVAARVGDVEALKEFLAAGVDASAIGPLSAAASGGHKEFVELLIANGANVAAKNEYGSTPLHNAATKEIAQLLITNGADINAKINDGSSPLIAAAMKGHKEVAELLIAKGADVNARSESVLGEDKTALDWAVEQSHTEIAYLLRKHGGKTAKGR